MENNNPNLELIREKSFLTKEIIYPIDDISKTEKLNHLYTNVIPKSYICSEYDNSLLLKIFEKQSKIINSNKLKNNSL
jgi:hypothetical protein